MKNFLLATQTELDAAKRLSDNVNGFVFKYTIDELLRGWIAISLADGATDGNLYDSRKAAVCHQLNPHHYAYMCLKGTAGGMDVKEAFTFLEFHRAAYDAGFQLSDPDARNGGYDLMMPVARESVSDQIAQMHARKRRSVLFKDS